MYQIVQSERKLADHVHIDVFFSKRSIQCTYQSFM